VRNGSLEGAVKLQEMKILVLCFEEEEMQYQADRYVSEKNYVGKFAE
jgi:hypothetical protein